MRTEIKERIEFVKNEIEEVIAYLSCELEALKTSIKMAEPRFKRGDFVYSSFAIGRAISIVESYDGEEENLETFAFICPSGGLYRNCNIGCALTRTDRPATESEKQELIDALRKAGKDWDFDKKELVDYIWRAESLCKYYYFDSYGCVQETIDCYTSLDTSRYNYGNYFRTAELAEEASKDYKKFMLSLKHS